MAEEIDVVVVGAGQAGLAVSHELRALGVDHVVLERDRVGSSWAGRWDSFCLVTPNHTIKLPGGEYAGPDPHGYLPRDQVVAHLGRYADSFAAPVRTGVAVQDIQRGREGGWRLTTASDTIVARSVILATGAYQKAYRPPAARSLSDRLPVLDAGEYRNPADLPEGAVLVVGSGQTGCQISEELLLSGRRVILACGRAPWVNRRVSGRDIVDWILETQYMDQQRESLPSPQSVLLANIQATGAGGGHDLHYRTLAGLGVELVGHLADVADGTVRFASDLGASVAFGDARRADLRNSILASCQASNLPAPEFPEPGPAPSPKRDQVAVRELGSAVVASGYRPAYTEVIRHPEAFDEFGFPIQRDGASTVLPGLYFIGVHFLRRRKSSLLMGVGDDATVVAQQVALAA